MMSTHALKGPPADLHDIPLDIRQVPPDRLTRISWHATGEPFFGTRAANRFDDASLPVENRFGTCYLGMSLTVAFAESILHDRNPEGGRFHVTGAEIGMRFAYRLDGPPLRLAKLTGAALKKLGGHGELSGTSDYAIPRQWSRAIAMHPDSVDGFMYMSRHVNDDIAVVLFRRDFAKPLAVTAGPAVPLYQHVDFLHTMAELNVKAS